MRRLLLSLSQTAFCMQHFHMHELKQASLLLPPLLCHQAVKRRVPLSVETCNCLLAILNLMPASLLLLLLLLPLLPLLYPHQAVKRRVPLSGETCPLAHVCLGLHC
jgi:hypothetical protein